MLGLIESQTKIDILVYLGIRGGCSGRQLARQLRKSATPVFKALRSLEKNKIIQKQGSPLFYTLNTRHPCYQELVSMIHKTFGTHRNKYHFLPKIKSDRKIDPIAVYEMAALRENSATVSPIPKFSDILRKRYA